MLDDNDPGFHSAIQKFPQPQAKRHNVWIIEHRDHKFYWGVSLHIEGGEVVYWHGPFDGHVAARNDLEATKAWSKRKWPLNSIKRPAGLNRGR